MSSESVTPRNDQRDALSLAIDAARRTPGPFVNSAYELETTEFEGETIAVGGDPGSSHPTPRQPTSPEEFYDGSLGETYDVNVVPAQGPLSPAVPVPPTPPMPAASTLPPIITDAQTREDVAKLAAVNNAAAGQILVLIVDGLRDLVARADAIHDVHKLFKSIAIVSLATGQFDLQVDEQPGIHVAPDVMEAAAALLDNMNPGRPLRQMDVRPLYEEEFHVNADPEGLVGTSGPAIQDYLSDPSGGDGLPGHGEG